MSSVFQVVRGTTLAASVAFLMFLVVKCECLIFGCISMERVFDFPAVLGKYSGQLNIGERLHPYFLLSSRVLIVCIRSDASQKPKCASASSLLVFHLCLVGLGALPSLLIAVVSRL